MKHKILTELFQGKDLANLLQKMHPEHLRDDLRQELFLILLETEDSKIIGLYERRELRFYVARVVLNMIASNQSPFHKKYRQYVKEFREWSSTINEDHFNHGDIDFSADTGGRVSYFRTDLCTDFNEAEEREMEHTRLVDAVNKCLESMPFYEREIMKDYARCGSAGKMIKEMQALTGHHIPKRSILATVKKVKEKIKEEVKAA